MDSLAQFQDGASLGVALTCRSWFKICAQELFRRLFVRSSQVHEVINRLSKEDSYIAQHARWLRIRGVIPWLSLPLLLSLLPGIDDFSIAPHLEDDISVEVPCSYHPSHPRLASVIHVASWTTVALSKLDLRSVRFSSGIDVLHLLAFFPQLSNAELWCCTIPSGAGSETVPPSPLTRLKRVIIHSSHDSSGVPQVASFAQWWCWPHPVGDFEVGPYPGLQKADVQCMIALLRLLIALQGWE